MKTTYVLLGESAERLDKLSAELFLGDDPALTIYKLPGNPIDGLEGIPDRLINEECTLGRIIAVVDLAKIERRAELTAWLDMLIHFADVLLMENSHEVSPAWLTALKKKFKGMPLLPVEWPLSRKSQMTVGEIIYPEARRITQYFEEQIKEEISIFVGEDDDEEEIVDEDEDPFVAEKYFSRDAAGRRAVKIITP